MDKKLVFLVLLFFLILGGFSVQLLYQTRLRQVRATSKTPSQQESILLAYSDGKKCTINPVVRAEDQTGVPNIQVCVTASMGDLSSPCGQTDDSGIINFTLTSNQPGVADIVARVNNSFDIPTKVTCEFK
ncbi:hypothetical protein A3D06_01410 [Candidatus Roizmanbacteria bacterium RIFCSPHIGHO2_02_FULL_40_9]|uniref:Big-1 domain-containing protein n=2 Tax=Candidatus Roizmaniibacteriota TaxID=1752723 RepID=A0A1F7IMH7_9BACT|nr:MAG: hypothetical protein A3D06_01410 [Candidatus Roizmanbacteria bacterium RIFCSPHIGHO2_02_FULL_40_9]OGK44510.1 MAG: hypothetical protein A2957_00550 [Candidatus Roizmanbacteria bacterium RIFCSPLOWO2_01_FULL_38_11]